MFGEDLQKSQGSTWPPTSDVQSSRLTGAGAGSIGSSAPQPLPESIATVLPRVYGKALTLREYAAKHVCSLKGQPQPNIEPSPQRAGLVGSLQDIDDILGGAISWLDELEVLIRG